MTQSMIVRFAFAVGSPLLVATVACSSSPQTGSGSANSTEGAPRCATLECEKGFECKTKSDGAGECVPLDAGGGGGGAPACATMECQQGFECKTKSDGSAECVPVNAGGGAPACATMECQQGFECQTQSDGSGKCVPH
jgi:hypothetical protein